jgi:hypothetical protein
MGRFTQQDHLGVREAVKERAEILGPLGRGQRFTKCFDDLSGFVSASGSGALGDAWIGPDYRVMRA